MRPGVDSAPRLLVGSVYDETAPVLSPDGRWLAYVSNESGRGEVYVRPFPETGAARWTVSVEGGSEPRWSHSGRELFYRTPRGQLLAVQVAPGATFTVLATRPLFDASTYAVEGNHVAYDVSPDDARFIMIRQEAGKSGGVVLVLNWQTELRAKLRR